LEVKTILSLLSWTQCATILCKELRKELENAFLLKGKLQRIDGEGYKAYQAIAGEYDLGGFLLYIDYVQSDPFAPPSRLRARVMQERAKFPPELFRGRTRSIALADLITRLSAVATGRYVTVSGSPQRGGDVWAERLSPSCWKRCLV
jgi:hypothetical protein